MSQPDAAENGTQVGQPPRGTITEQRLERRRDEIKEIVDSKVLDDSTVKLAKSLLTRDIPLGNLSEAEHHEFRYLLENRFLEIIAEHPPEGSYYQGERRKLAFGDPREDQSALTGQQRSELERIKQVILTRIGRAVGGWQQEKMNERTQRRIHEKRDESDENGTGLM